VVFKPLSKEKSMAVREVKAAHIGSLIQLKVRAARSCPWRAASDGGRLCARATGHCDACDRGEADDGGRHVLVRPLRLRDLSGGRLRRRGQLAPPARGTQHRRRGAEQVLSRSFTPLLQCQSKDCKARGTAGKLQLQSRGSKFVKFQEMRIQELVRPRARSLTTT
jgi:DNA replicative helicase MCM subunit Mcm2 (Cdc46/Mcm family)